jgi:hypothetical protein
MILISGNDQTSNRLRPLAYSSPEPVQTTGTVAPAADITREQASVLASRQHPPLAGRAGIRGDCGIMNGSPNRVCGFEQEDTGPYSGCAKVDDASR